MNTVAPTVSGATPVGSLLSGTDGTWTGSPTFTYQWTSNGTNIGGATGATYTTVSGDLGNAIGRKVTGTNGAGSATAASSNTITVTSSSGTVGPAASWNGTLGSGGSVPTNPIPYQPGPAIKWYNTPHQRVAANFVVGVDAECFQGISGGVTFQGDIATTTVASPTFLVDTNPYNGVTRYRYGYFITLNWSAFMTRTSNATGDVRIVASAVPVNGSLATKVSQVLVLHPAAAEFTYTATIGPSGSGATFTNIASAFQDWLNNASGTQLEAPRFHIVSNGNYEMGFPVLGVEASKSRSPTKGLAVVDHAPGVVANLKRGTYNSGAMTWSSAFDPADTSYGTYQTSWNWIPGVQSLELRDVGIDIRNWAGDIRYFGTNNPDGIWAYFWLNGCRVFNSIGVRDTVYFNGGSSPFLNGLNVNATSPAVNFVGFQDDCIFEYTNTFNYPQPSNFDGRVSNCAVYSTGQGGDLMQFWQRNYIQDCNINFIYTGTASLQLSYSGPGTGTCDFLSASNGTINLNEGGATVQSFHGNPSRVTGANATYTQMKASIDAWSAGRGSPANGYWTVTVLDDNWSTYYLGGTNTGFFGVQAKTVPAVCTPHIDAHNEAQHFQQSGNTSLVLEGLIWRNNKLVRTWYTTGTVVQTCRDSFHVNNISDSDTPKNGFYYENYHTNWWYNWSIDSFQDNGTGDPNAAPDCDQYSLFYGSLWGSMPSPFFTRITCNMTGTPGTVINNFSLVSDGVHQWELVSGNVTLDGGGNGSGTFFCTTGGSIAIPTTGTVTTIITTTAGWSTVTNPTNTANHVGNRPAVQYNIGRDPGGLVSDQPTNVNINDTSGPTFPGIATLVTNHLAGNFTPVGGLLLATTVVPRLRPDILDRDGNTRAANDIAGAYASGVTPIADPVQPSGAQSVASLAALTYVS